jgi:hypothetical protein
LPSVGNEPSIKQPLDNPVSTVCPDRLPIMLRSHTIEIPGYRPELLPGDSRITVVGKDRGEIRDVKIYTIIDGLITRSTAILVIRKG